MGKRRHRSAERENKELWKRLKRLERQLEKKKHDSVAFRRSASLDRRSNLSECASAYEHRSPPFPSSNSIFSVASRNTAQSETLPLLEERPAPGTEAVVIDALKTAPLNSATESSLPIAAATDPGEEELSGDILQLMGQRILPERTPAQAIHKDLVIRIDEILKKGLPAEEKQQLLQKFPPPSNCLIIDPPKLNLEVKACFQEAIIKLDSRIVEKQACITAGIAGLVNLLSTMFKLDVNEKLSMIETLSGVIRLLSDLQRDESSIRRNLIMKNINMSLRDTLALTVPDEWLFGKDFEEKLKAA